MAKLYFGNGECMIEGTEIRGVQIKYKGSIVIEKTANDNFAIAQQNNNIMIFPIGEGFLNKLFTYIGDFRIISVIVSDNNAESVTTTLKRVMDYADLLHTNAEDMTNKSEELSSGYISKTKVSKSRVNQSTINNQHTSKYGTLYLEDGIVYTGSFHVHLKDGGAMTGATHTKDSQDLYFKQVKDGEIIDKLVPTKNPSHVPRALSLSPRTGRVVRETPRGRGSGGSGGGY